MCPKATTPNFVRLWAKTDKERSDRFHSVLFHMLDVAAVGLRFWNEVLPKALKDRLELEPNAAAFLAGAHDIGKCAPGFQKRVPCLSNLSGLPFSENDWIRPHGFISAHALAHYLGNNDETKLWGQIVGGHHGVFPRSCDLQLRSDSLGNSEWHEARCSLLETLAKLVGFEASSFSTPRTCDPVLTPLIGGFVSVVDWIASNQKYFPCACDLDGSADISPEDYWNRAQRQAQQALEELGWTPCLEFAAEKQFADVFPNCATPTGVQKAVIDAVQDQRAPYLLIVEAAMGQGKTEAALYAADLAICRGFARGMYLALPTQATSDAMYRRVLEHYLKNRGHQGNLNLQLVHGNALLADLKQAPGKALNGEIQTFDVKGIADDTDEGIDETADLEAQSWFTARKRSLLAAFGVGTIDQSLLSVLQTKHWFVRMFGLAGKVVIFDEVHAYDAYMSTILERLLRWLAELDCTVVLLSATLPDARRKALARAYSGSDDAEYKRYPRITLARPLHFRADSAGEAPSSAEVKMEESRTVRLTCLRTEREASPRPGEPQLNAPENPSNARSLGPKDLNSEAKGYPRESTSAEPSSPEGATQGSSLASLLQEKLQNGGCAAVICNTVDRSIEVFSHLRDTLKGTECLLFHARTLQMWRREREKAVLMKFGKRDPQDRDPEGRFVNPARPKRAVLVATQVVEQSLDLDFDLMVSEIAPIDLLLQRSGRLHRHPRARPKGLEQPELILLCDAGRDGLPPESFGKSIEYVYDRHILLRTWLALREREQIEVPAEIEALIEFVYGKDDAPENGGWPEALQAAKQKMEFERSESEKKACKLLVSKPKAPEDLIEDFNHRLADDEDPEVHATVRAATREGDPSITVVMLPTNEQMTARPEIPEVKGLLDRSVKISHRGLFRAYLENGVQPTEWSKNTHLRYARLQRHDENGTGQIEGYTLLVDKNLGVVIMKGGGT